MNFWTFIALVQVEDDAIVLVKDETELNSATADQDDDSKTTTEEGDEEDTTTMEDEDEATTEEATVSSLLEGISDRCILVDKVD